MAFLRREALLIVYYAAREIKDPGTFRATLSLLWLLLNVTLLSTMLAAGQANAQSMELAALVLPGFIVGVTVGSLVRVKAWAFKAMTWAMLFGAGFVQLLRAVQRMFS